LRYGLRRAVSLKDMPWVALQHSAAELERSAVSTVVCKWSCPPAPPAKPVAIRLKRSAIGVKMQPS